MQVNCRVEFPTSFAPVSIIHLRVIQLQTQNHFGGGVWGHFSTQKEKPVAAGPVEPVKIQLVTLEIGTSLTGLTGQTGPVKIKLVKNQLEN